MSAYRPYPKTKPSGVEWLGDVPEEWEVWKLAHAFTLIGSGTTPKTDNREYYDDGVIPWVNTGDLNDGQLLDCEKRITDLAIAHHTSLKTYPAGSILIAMYGATIGKLSMLQFPATVNQACCVFAGRSPITSKFMFYWFLGLRHQIISLATGGGQPNVSQDILRTLRVSCPATPEQIQIAAFLDRECGKLDALQAKQERLIELLKEKRQALISHAVTRGLDPTAKLKPSGIEWLGDVPVHWVASKVKWVSVTVKTGGTPSNPSWFTDEPEVPWLTPGDFCEDFFKISPRRYVSQAAIAKREAPSFPSSSIFVIGIEATLGKVARLDERQLASSNQQINAIVPSNRIESDYLLFSLVAQTEQMKNCSNASTLGIMNQEKTKGLHIALPPLAEQRAIVAHLDEKCGKIDQLKAKAERAIELLKERRSALISAAVTGKIDVREV